MNCMKKIFISILLFVFVLNTFGQSYHALIRSNTFWDVLHGDGSQMCWYSGGNRYFFEGDSVIQGQQYKMVRSYKIINLNDGPFCPPFAVDANMVGISAFMREDTIAEKIYVHYQGSDDLLYDFSLSAGDTLNSLYAGQGTVLIIDSVRTISLLDGSARQIFYLNNGEYYIESIGGSQGLYTPLAEPFEFFEDPTCVVSDNVQLWGDECFPYVGVQEIELSELSISPNPAQNTVTIHSELPMESIVVFNVLAKKVYQQDHLFQKQTDVDISYLKQGIYFIEVSAGDMYSIKKMVKVD
jgi:hypothetical protein